jgi:hypothetical protein
VSEARKRTTGLSGATQAVVTLRVDGQEVTVDQRTLTMSERQLVRRTLAKVEESDELDALVAVVWIVLRRSRPELTFDEVCDSITAGDLADAEIVDDPDETSPEG